MSDPHPKIEPLFDKIHHAIDEHEVDGHRGVLAKKRRNERSHLERAEEHGCRHADFPQKLRFTRDDFALGRTNIREDLSTASNVGAPFRGERHAARGALQQAHAERLLQHAERAHDRGQRLPQLLRRSREAVFVDDGDDGFHGAQFVQVRLLSFPD